MAILKYSPLVSEVKGQLGNAVFQRMGQTLGVRVQQSKNYTVSNSALNWRVKFQQIAAAWNALDSSNKATWVYYAPTWPAVDRFGNTISLSGFQLFMQVNGMAFVAGYPIIEACSPWAILDTAVASIASLFMDSHSWAFDITPIADTNVIYICYASSVYPAQSIDRNAKTKFVQYLLHSTTMPYNMYSWYAAKNTGHLKVGSAIKAEIWEFNTHTGVYKRIIDQWCAIEA